MKDLEWSAGVSDSLVICYKSKYAILNYIKFVSRVSTVEVYVNRGGPPSKSNYISITDSEKYREGKVKESP